MKTPGDYALMHANGMSWKDIVAEIRAESLAARLVSITADHTTARGPEPEDSNR